MVAPYPYEAVSGRISPAQRAADLCAHYAWLARWSQEISSDPDIDLKKVALLSLIHCRLFVALVGAIGSDAAVEAAFVVRNIAWGTRSLMAADLTAVSTAAQALFVWVRDNMPEARDPVTLKGDPTSTALIEEVRHLAKPHPVEARIAGLRATFGAVPTA